MGQDKTTVPLHGRTLALLAAEALRGAAEPVLAVGHEAGTGLTAVDDRREGPLVALVDGAASLGPPHSIILLAADMPFVTAGLLRHLAEVLGEADAALPVAGGRDQPLCAVYASSAIEAAQRLVASGARAMHELIGALTNVVRVAEEEWTRLAPPYALLDVDSPEDLAEAERILEAPE